MNSIWKDSFYFSLYVSAEPEISDDDLTHLVNDINNRVGANGQQIGAGWSRITITYSLGDDRKFDNFGGDSTLKIFLGLRHKDRYLKVKTAGGEIAVGLAKATRYPLFQELSYITQLAEKSGGPQSDQTSPTISASTQDYIFEVSGTYGDLTEDAVKLWQKMPLVPMETVSAEEWGGSPDFLNIGAGAEKKAAIEQPTAGQSKMYVLIDIR